MQKVGVQVGLVLVQGLVQGGQGQGGRVGGGYLVVEFVVHVEELLEC